jgi:predicted Fe-Mo cluster-binding NifX family protein
MRWNPEKDMLESEEKIYGMIGDCDKVIVREIGSDQRNFLQGQKIAVVQTDETIITRVLMQYMQTIVQKESDTCCCP